MNMKRLLTLVAFFATIHTSAQQVNPVPDYVFANRMSAGRNTVTDTAAYFSIGPRYGATRGMMPPMVVDTASFSANKRNGLLIFSVQKNKFLYWDSVGVKWAEMAGTAGTALTSADTAALLSTRAWRQKGIDSLAAIRIAGSGTTSYIPKFSAATTLANSSLFNTSSGGLGINQPSVTEYARKTSLEAANESGAALRLRTYGTTGVFEINTDSTNTIIKTMSNSALLFGVNNVEAGRIFNNGRYYIGASAADNGYLLDVNGTLRSVNGANFATTSGNVGIGNASPSFKLSVNSSDYQTSNFQSSLIAAGANYSSIVIGQIAANSSAIIGYARDTNNAANSFFYVTPYGSADGGQFRMSAAGNVGIGFTSNATYKMDVNGTLRSVNGANFATTSGNVGVGTATPDASAKVDVTSTTQGFLPPRMTTAQRDAISSPAAGLVIYNTTTSKLQVYTTAWTDLH